MGGGVEGEDEEGEKYAIPIYGSWITTSQWPTGNRRNEEKPNIYYELVKLTAHHTKTSGDIAKVVLRQFTEKV